MSTHDYYISDEEYATAAANGISRNTLNNRVWLLGWDKKRATTQKPQKRTNRDNWAAVAEKNGIAANTFYQRVNAYGWDMERAATEPPHPQPYQLAVDAKRKIPRELYELAQQNGISLGTFKSRIYQSGWDMERAATEPVWSKAEVDAYGLKQYKAKYGDNPNGVLFPHRPQRVTSQ